MTAGPARRAFFVTGMKPVAARGLRLAGWVGNCVVPEFPRREANVATLESRLPVPCLGIVPWLHDRDLARAAAALSGTLFPRPS